MYINKHNLAIKSVIGKERVGFDLSGLLIEPDCTVATDGKLLAICTAPIVEDHILQVEEGREIKERRLIPSSAIQKAERNMLKKSSKPVLLNTLVQEENSKNACAQVSFTSTDIETTDTVKTDCMEGRFPEYKNYLPAYKDTVDITLEAEQIEIIGKLFKNFRDDFGKGVRRVKLTVPIGNDKGGPVIYTATNGDTGQDLTVIQTPHKPEE